MGSLDDNGIYVYDENDRPAPLHTLLNLGQASTSAAVSDLRSNAVIKNVANITERNAYEQDMRDAGYPPTTERPLYVDRADNGALERNRGTGWETMVDNTLLSSAMNNPSTAWTRDNRFFKKNGWVQMRLRQRRDGPAWDGTATLTDSMHLIPARFRPSEFVVDVGFVHHRNDVYRTVLITVQPDGRITANNLRIATGNWLNANIVWPTDDGGGV